MPQNDSGTDTQFLTPPGSPQNNTATPGETITLDDQWSVSLDQNTSTGHIILQDTLNGVIPASDVVVNNGGTYNAGIITWDLGTFTGVGTKTGSVSFGDYTATITVPTDYAQNQITSLATITPVPGDVDPSNNAVTNSITIVCFCPGTLIATPAGSVAVEHLQVGDQVITASGRTRPIRWLGHRTIRVGDHPRPHDVHPVRVAKGAFGDNRPTHDLYLSPGHPVLVGADPDGTGGYLVPIMCLINGTTIARVSVREATYWHVELDEHDVMIADGLFAESYIDLGSRPWFDGSDDAIHDPDMASPEMPSRCRPVRIDGPVVEAERRRLSMVMVTKLAAAACWPTDVSTGALAGH